MLVYKRRLDDAKCVGASVEFELRWAVCQCIGRMRVLLLLHEYVPRIQRIHGSWRSELRDDVPEVLPVRLPMLDDLPRERTGFNKHQLEVSIMLAVHLVVLAVRFNRRQETDSRTWTDYTSSTRSRTSSLSRRPSCLISQGRRRPSPAPHSSSQRWLHRAAG